MLIILLSVVLIFLFGTTALVANTSSRHANTIGPMGAILGCLMGLVPVIRVLWTGEMLEFRHPWDVPYGSFFMQVDALSAFFLLPILLLCALAALYGSEYMRAYDERKNTGASWFFFNLLVASMVMVVIARNGVLFLVFWEIMALSSFFLVTFENEKESVRRAGWIYLVATHLGTVFLLLLFLLLGHKAGGGVLDFDAFSAAHSQIAPVANVAFLLAVVGFGAKAGFIPFHVWLPEAHPAAPSHVSAVMSGVMIKTGIYGLLRTLTFLGSPPPWWGEVMIGIGLVSGILGVLFALAQHDLKRLLAYHSVENIGIIALGLGLGILGLGLDMPVLAVLGFAGGLLHVLNHALFKGLLFLGAGSVLHATGTGEMDHLGGLMKRMPWTAVTFLIGAAAISGLPPLNGFVSEFLIYVGALSATGKATAITAGAALIAGLALIGGLAAACFTKAFGIVFLGEPRSGHAAHGHEAGWAMRLSMLALAALCVIIGILAPQAARLTTRAVALVTALPVEEAGRHMATATVPLSSVVLVSGVFLFLLALLVGLRKIVLSGRAMDDSVTWDCGYARPAPSMQYSSSSFAQPLTTLFKPFLRTRRIMEEPDGLFPAYSSFRTETADIFLQKLYHPLFLGVAWTALRLRWLQEGRIQLYILYIALALFALLIWNLR